MDMFVQRVGEMSMIATLFLFFFSFQSKARIAVRYVQGQYLLSSSRVPHLFFPNSFATRSFGRFSEGAKE
jgi:hypothetical protein